MCGRDPGRGTGAKNKLNALERPQLQRRDPAPPAVIRGRTLSRPPALRTSCCFPSAGTASRLHPSARKQHGARQIQRAGSIGVELRHAIGGQSPTRPGSGRPLLRGWFPIMKASVATSAYAVILGGGRVPAGTRVPVRGLLDHPETGFRNTPHERKRSRAGVVPG